MPHRSDQENWRLLKATLLWSDLALVLTEAALIGFLLFPGRLPVGDSWAKLLLWPPFAYSTFPAVMLCNWWYCRRHPPS